MDARRRKVCGDVPPCVVDLILGALAMFGRLSPEELGGPTYFTVSREDATSRTTGAEFTIPTKR